MDIKKTILVLVFIMFMTMGSAIASSVDNSFNSKLNIASTSNLNSSDSSLSIADFSFVSDQSGLDNYISDLNIENNKDNSGKDSNLETNVNNFDQSGADNSNSLSDSVSDFSSVNGEFNLEIANYGSDNVSSSDVIFIKNESEYSNSNQTVNEIIQSIFDSAESGVMIQFLGSNYSDLHLIIEKPLNIVSFDGTIINSSLTSPIFQIHHGGFGSNISGFTLSAKDYAISISNSENISIKNNTFNGGNGIYAGNLLNLNILYNTFENNGFGINFNHVTNSSIINNLFKSSSARAVYIGSSKNIKIWNNSFLSCAQGIYEIDNDYLDIQYNNLTKCGYGTYGSLLNYPISFTGSSHVTYKNNVISGERDQNYFYRGIHVTGTWDSNNDFTNNAVYYVSSGMEFDEGFVSPSSGSVNLGNMAFIGCSGHCLELKDSVYNSITFLGTLYYDISLSSFKKPNCNKAHTPNEIFSTLKPNSNGDGFDISLVDKNGNPISGFMSFEQDILINGSRASVSISDGKGSFNLPAGDYAVEIGNQHAQNGVNNVHSNGQGSNPSNPNSNNNGTSDSGNNSNSDNSGTSDSSGSGNNEGTSGSGSGTGSEGSSGSSNGDSGSGSLSSSSSSPVSDMGSSSDSSSSSAGASSSGASSSSASSSSSSSIAKSLTVDDEFFRVAGVGGLLILIILVVAVYYSKDIKEMLKK